MKDVTHSPPSAHLHHPDKCSGDGTVVCHWYHLLRREFSASDAQLIIQNVFYIPIFLQYVKSYTSLMSGTFILATTFPQAMWGVGAGYYISKTSHYKRIVVSS